MKRARSYHYQCLYNTTPKWNTFSLLLEENTSHPSRFLFTIMLWGNTTILQSCHLLKRVNLIQCPEMLKSFTQPLYNYGFVNKYSKCIIALDSDWFAYQREEYNVCFGREFVFHKTSFVYLCLFRFVKLNDRKLHMLSDYLLPRMNGKKLLATEPLILPPHSMAFFVIDAQTKICSNYA